MTTLTAPSRFFTEEHEIFREQVRNFVNKEISPYIDQWEHDGLFPKSLYKRMGELGFLGIRYPEQYGGSNGDIWMTIAFCEEMCRCRALGLPMSVLVHTDMSSTHIARYGSEVPDHVVICAHADNTPAVEVPAFGGSLTPAEEAAVRDAKAKNRRITIEDKLVSGMKEAQ